MGESAPTIEYATATAADAPAVRATRFVAWVGVVVGLTGLTWTGMMWLADSDKADWALTTLLRFVKPQVADAYAVERAHVWVEGGLSLLLLGSSAWHLIARRARYSVYGMRLYAVGLFGYTVLVAGVWVVVREGRIWTDDEEQMLYLAASWIPRQVHELVYAVFVLFFMRVPRRARRVEGHAEDLASR